MALDSVLDFEPAKQLTVTITSYPGSHRLGGFPAVRECNALPTSCPQFVVYRQALQVSLVSACSVKW